MRLTAMRPMQSTKRRLRAPCCGFLQTVGMTDVKQFLVVVLAVFTAVSWVWANLGDSDDRIYDLYGNLVDGHFLDDGTGRVLYPTVRSFYFAIFADRRSDLG